MVVAACGVAVSSRSEQNLGASLVIYAVERALSRLSQVSATELNSYMRSTPLVRGGVLPCRYGDAVAAAHAIDQPPRPDASSRPLRR